MRRLPGLLAIALCAWSGIADAAHIRGRLEAILADPVQGLPLVESQGEWEHLQRFYAERDYLPVWVGEPGPLPKAKDFVRTLSQADREGLVPQDYGPAALAALLDGRTPTELATLEILFSIELLHYAGDLQRGRTAPARVDPELFAYPTEFDRAAVLQGAAAAGDIGTFLAELAPGNMPYRRLKTALEHYRRIEAHGGWPSLPEGPSLKTGMRDSRVAVLRERLAASGDLEQEYRQPTDGNIFDDELENAVMRFQRRFGLDADGVVGRQTLAQLNVPVAERISQIALNMERWRWMPDNLGERHIHVNLAGFQLDIYEHDRSVLNMRVIVGRTYRQTPVFFDRVTYMEINPTWTVPSSIARNDLIPKIRENPAYLPKNNFRVYAGWSGEAPVVDPFSIDWSAVDPARMPYRFVQLPGPENALGRIKFMFPNRFNVYLHDTPARELFNRTVRTFSSGCIRVEDPMDLARHLLENNAEWDMEKLEAAIAGGNTQVIRLGTPVPIHLIYSTAWLDDEGVVHFRNDIYGRDAQLRKEL